MITDIDKPPFFLNFIEKAMFIIFIMIFLVVGYVAFKEKMYSMKAHCDYTYGEGGWELNETTGSDACPSHVGQCWQCVPKNHPPELEIG